MKHAQLLKQILTLITPAPERMKVLGLDEKRSDATFLQKMDWSNIRRTTPNPEWGELKQWRFIPNKDSMIDIGFTKPITLLNVDNLLGKIELYYPEFNSKESIFIEVGVNPGKTALSLLKTLITEQRDKLILGNGCLDTAVSVANAGILLTYAMDNTDMGTRSPADKTENNLQNQEKKSYAIDTDVANLIGFIKQFINKFTENEQMKITHFNLGYQVATLYGEEIKIPTISEDSNEVNFIFAAICKKNEALIESGNIPLEDLADFWYARNNAVNDFILGYDEASRLVGRHRRSRRNDSDYRDFDSRRDTDHRSDRRDGGFLARGYEETRRKFRR